MSSPPPDYNPAASVLQGGTAPIVPVMGGGGMSPSPDYNAGESVLAVGGTAPPIVAVSGGGYDDESDPQEDVLPSTAPVQIEVYESFEKDTIETYRNEYIERLRKNFSANGDNDWKGELKVLIDAYRAEYDAKWGPTPNLPKDTSPIIPDKLFETIPNHVKTIIVFPNIDGNIQTFLKTSQFLYTQGFFENNSASDLKFKKGISVIIYGNLFRIGDEDNIPLLYLFLKMKNSNRDTLFLLRDPSEDKDVGLSFKGFENLPGDKPLLNFLSPSYLICTRPVGLHNGIVFTNEPIITKKEGEVSKGDTLEEAYANYYKLSRTLPNVITPSAPPQIGGNPLCKSLIHLENENSLGTFNLEPEYLTFIRPGVRQSNPLICIDDLGVQHSPFISGAFRSGEEDAQFFQSPRKVKLLIDGKAYLVRVATGISNNALAKHLQLKDNWEKGIFARGEAELLNDLQLSPELLYTVFGVDWKVTLADFLDHVSNPEYSCYSNVSIIPSRVCDHTREFIQKVVEYRYKEELDRSIFKNISKGEPGVWPEEFTKLSVSEYKKHKMGIPFTEGDTTKVNLLIVSTTGQSGLFQYEAKGEIKKKLEELREKYKDKYEILE